MHGFPLEEGATPRENALIVSSDPRPELPALGRTVDGALHSPSTLRNREPILEVLARVLPPSGLVLEVASGTGEHAAWFAPRLPHLAWQPSDRDPAVLRSVDAWAERSGAPNLLPPLRLDARSENWPVERASAVVCINMIHISPWEACQGLLRGAGRVLEPGHPLYVYGAFRREGRTAPSNVAFDRALREEDPAWGVRDLETVAEEAALWGLDLVEVVEMPAHNLSVVFRRRG